MLSKVSTFVGPNGFFSTGNATPSLVLSLDAAGYTGSGVWFDLSTFNNDGISDGSVSWNSEGGGSFEFDGSSAYFLFGKSNYTFNPSTSSTYGVTFSSNSVTSVEPDGNWDTKQAVSSESYSSGVRLKFQTSGTNPFLMCGLSDSPDAFLVNYSKPNYGFYVQGTNLLTIVEGGDFNVNPMSGTYSDTTNYIIVWDGSDVKYYVDEVLVYTSATTPTNPLYLYCTFLNSAFTINNIEFGPYAQGIPIGNSPYVQGIPTGNSPYTMEAWFKSDSFAPSEQGTLIGWGDSGLMYKSNVLRLNANGFTNYWWGDDISVTFTGTSSMSINNWYYAAATYDGTTRKLYLNGNLVQSSAPSAPLEVDNIQSLKVGYSYTNYFNGKISKVKVHSKALSDSRILSNFNSDKVRHGYVLGSMTFSSSNSSYLISSSNNYQFGTNDFTIEAFVNLQLSTYLYGGIVSLRANGQSYISINTVLTNTSSPLIEFFAGGVYYNFTASNDMWYHTAISRVSGTTSFYVNGTLFTEITDNNTYNASNDVVVGRYYTDLDDYYTEGLISNVRIINGTGLYSGPSITIPNTPLSSVSNTELLIISQKTSPTSDVSGNSHPVTASNIGWTSSLPDFYQYNYPDFSDTTGLFLYGYMAIVSNQIYLTNLSGNNVGNIYTDDAIRYDRNFSLEWNFECVNGSGADGFCVQWTNANNLTGGNGGGVGAILTSAAINVFQFQTYINNRIVYRYLGSEIGLQSNSLNFRQNLYYWMDYNYSTSTMYISYATTNTKPLSPQHTFTSVTFDTGNYYLGFGAANGGQTDNHILKSFNLSFI